jgi:geranylgeranyl diphosphate synthase, type II
VSENFLYELEVKQKFINDELKALITKPHKTNIYQAMSYSLLAGGKRIRPLLFLSICDNLNFPIVDALPFACAIEMIHTYSLIHDDLPSMDNDDFRRGKPTNHKVYGEAIAVLAGDGLLNLAYEVMLDCCLAKNNINSLKAMKEISYASGVNGMIGGQAMDILSENKVITKENLLYIHQNKTGAILKSCITGSAILANEPSTRLELYSQAGSALGLAFQIQDDILDITSSSDILGKNINSDIDNNKSTYVSLFGLEQSKIDYKKYSNKAISLFDELDIPFLKYLATLLMQRKN